MADKQSKDVYAQLALLSVLESAPVTLTFKKLETGVGVTEKIAWILNKVEYFIGSPTAAIFNGTDDLLLFGLSVSNGWATPSMVEETIIDLNEFSRRDFGAAASGGFMVQPIVKDLSTLPGGGILVPPNPLYLWAKGSGLAAAETVFARIWYQILEMAPQDYLELLQARTVLES